ncbi:hypothetical protein C8R48DRAFT_705761, partial [Suillus tomentosus]
MFTSQDIITCQRDSAYRPVSLRLQIKHTLSLLCQSACIVVNLGQGAAARL